VGFHEVQFPPQISYGSRGGPGHSTAIIEVDSGAEERIARWSSARRRYDVAWGVKSQDNLADLIAFYLARQGAAYGFRYKDWSDFTTASDGQDDPDDGDQQIGVGDGSETRFQLVKKYTSGGVTRTRNITKPVADTTVVAIDGAAQESGWTVNTTTGIVTFSSAPALNEVITAGCEFDVPVRFGRAIDELLEASIEAYDIRSAEIPLVEIIDEGELSEEAYAGGASESSISANYSLSVAEGLVQTFVTSTASLKLILPTITNLPPGGPYFVLVNDSTSTETLTVTDADGNTLGTIAPDNAMTIYVGYDGTTKTWFGIDGALS